MVGAPLLVRVRGLWVGLTGVTVSFPVKAGVAVVASPGSRLCPPGWMGVVRIGEAAIATAASVRDARLLRDVLGRLAVPVLTDPACLRGVLPVADLLGPAWLAYLDRDSFRPARRADAVEPLPPGHPDLLAMLDGVPDAESAESGIAELTSEVFVVSRRGRVVAAAGWRRWPDDVAHLGVLTAPQARGRGLGRAVASAATAHALEAHLLPQWRARPEPSRRIANSLGFQELGAQISIRLNHDRV
jgi:RimJ/RimL family protein N-acetyltransferase